MYYPLAEERPQLRSAISQEIAALEVELYSITPQLAVLERLLKRKAELEIQLDWLRRLDLQYEGIG